jgi:hypothetical protein
MNDQFNIKVFVVEVKLHLLGLFLASTELLQWFQKSISEISLVLSEDFSKLN